jgi:hypothetical protein
LDDRGAIASRHVDHPDNDRVVHALIRDLREIGYCPYLHCFSFEGRTLKNVIADLPGKGIFSGLKPNLRERLREVLDRKGLKIEEIQKMVGLGWLQEKGISKYSKDQLTQYLQKLMMPKWFPWWLRFCMVRLPGAGAEIVLLGAHFDSTASRGHPYDPVSDPAPGADDNASGIATILAAARYLKRFDGELKHTVRFCFFNAEEVGIVGSNKYATKLKQEQAPLRAVICTDMVGWDSDAFPIFEIHAGYTDTAVRDASVSIAEKIQTWSSTLGNLVTGQIYSGTISSSGADRSIFDPAINRSDHASFHQQGWPAVVVSEDFFINLTSEPAEDANPNYHLPTDISINAKFGADISCVIARAAYELAAS